ncbi:tetratricopeptide repeat protein [candidate division KSB1 bacterium]|nr:tetratricopeptide repeat protein [candidate division KSB1 bacterium]
MKKWFSLALSIVILLSIVGCGKKLTEEQLRAQAMDYENKEQWDQVVKVYEELIKRFPDSQKADVSLYQLGGLYASSFKDFDKSIDAYKRLIEKYPQSDLVVQAQFMIGYRYANDIKDMDKAREAYNEFLEKYPDHELSSSVKWELDHLGQDISDIELQFGSGESAQK